MALIAVRAIFVLVAAGLAVTLLRGDASQVNYLRVFLPIMALTIGLIVLDVVSPIKRIETITSVYFGVLLGLLLTYVFGLALAPYFTNPLDLRAVQSVVGLVIVYTTTSFVMQTKDDFRFITLCGILARGERLEAVHLGYQRDHRWSHRGRGGNGHPGQSANFAPICIGRITEHLRQQ